MEPETRNTVYVGKDLIVKFEIGEYGKFVRFQRKDTWINLSEKAWNFLVNNISMLSKTFDEACDWGVRLTEGKTVKVGQFKGATYITLCQETKVGDVTHETYINMNKEEWDDFLFSQTLFNHLINQYVQYSSEDNNWHFIKDAVKKDDCEIKYRLVPRMMSLDEVTMLYAYLIAKEIRLYVKQNCLGCSLDAPDKLSHMGCGTGCLGEWSDAVLMHYMMIKKNVCLQEALDKLNKVMKWKLKLDDVNKDILYYVVINYDDFDAMPIGYNTPSDIKRKFKLPQAYNKLFEYLDL